MYQSLVRYARKMTQKLHPVVLSGPSGCGKSTLIKKLTTEFPTKFGFSVSHTTRAPRPNEIDGKDYHFTTLEAINQKIEAGEFIESATFSGNKYGTSKKAVHDVLETGKICILDIDSQGVKSIKKTDLHCVLIFIKPPSLEELERRLRERGTETEEAIQKRLESAKAELDYATEAGSYHFTIVNDDLERAYKELKEIISKEISQL
ncbi:guanylate kinase isoform X3 [Hydra vulgaris]|uniref:guanylate kinase isoform X3 n=1 Tax=Hydra vulgaris TaxID=6087 RepID=UPI001F5E8994|nr:guanylate kinase isoform X2 [Hydra vulgaris]